MTAPGFTAHGKQVLALGAHYADAADIKAAQFIAEACEAKAKGWQPIETAPRDGTELLGNIIDTFGGEYVLFRWVVCKTAGYEFDGWTRGWETASGYDVGYSPVSPTHWMPLPSAPVSV